MLKHLQRTQQVHTVRGAESARGGAHAGCQNHRDTHRVGHGEVTIGTRPGHSRERRPLSAEAARDYAASTARPTPPSPTTPCAPRALHRARRIKNFNFLYESVSFSALSEFFSRSSPLFRLPEMIFFLYAMRV